MRRVKKYCLKKRQKKKERNYLKAIFSCQEFYPLSGIVIYSGFVPSSFLLLLPAAAVMAAAAAATGTAVEYMQTAMETAVAAATAAVTAVAAAAGNDGRKEEGTDPVIY